MTVKLNVIVYKRPNMFEVHDSYLNMLGYIDLKLLFTDPNFKSDIKELVLYYPERFLNILEQRALVGRLTAQNYTNVTIVTHSVYVVQTVNKNQLRVVCDEDIPESDGRFKLSNDAVGLQVNFNNLISMVDNT